MVGRGEINFLPIMEEHCILYKLHGVSFSSILFFSLLKTYMVSKIGLGGRFKKPIRFQKPYRFNYPPIHIIHTEFIIFISFLLFHISCIIRVPGIVSSFEF